MQKKLIGVLFAALAACGNSDVGTEGKVVGSSCTSSGGPSGSCAEGSKCATDSDFPGGSCVKVCLAQSDCPDGSACIQENGGLCVLECNDASDCRDGYNCVAKSTVNPAGSAKVCLLQ